jgi:Type II CAAX prenyl endopeptidase Rce1-like
MTLHQYLEWSRQPRYSVLFAAPLLLLYEGLAFLLSHSAFAGVRNGADVLLKTLFVSLGGQAGLAAFGMLLLGVGGTIVWRDQRRRAQQLKPRVFGGMLAESLCWAALFGPFVALLTSWALEGPALAQATGGPVASLPIATQLVVSLGAGLYEELLFRVLLIAGLTLLAMRFGVERRWAVPVAVVLSALIFSAFHYVGPYGDRLTLPSFMFRAIAGLVLSGLYVWRGFGITAWTHALYDVGLAVF